jgi:hypothetical protein
MTIVILLPGRTHAKSPLTSEREPCSPAAAPGRAATKGVDRAHSAEGRHFHDLRRLESERSAAGVDVLSRLVRTTPIMTSARFRQPVTTQYWLEPSRSLIPAPPLEGKHDRLGLIT